MTINPFTTIGDYPAMLAKIALTTFIITVPCILLLSWQIPEFAAYVDYGRYEIPVAGVKITLGVLVPALAVALVSRVFKLHDRVSDLLGIRRRFDVEAILFPMVIASGASLDVEKIQDVRRRRSQLMDATFYKYASGTNPVIDKHYVTLALDHWTWYWILLEASIVWGTAGLLLLCFSRPTAAALIELAVLLVLWVMARIRDGCVRYALDEVREILRDKDRRAEIAKVLNAL